jgi:hypothetical protein
MGISTAKSGEFEGIFRAHDQIASTAITSMWRATAVPPIFLARRVARDVMNSSAGEVHD